MKLSLVVVGAVCLVTASRAAEPFRLTVAPGSAKWSLQERTPRGWSNLLSDAEVRATHPDGSPLTFTSATTTSDGKAIVLDSDEMRLKLITRWLPPSKLPGTVVILPEAYAKRSGVALGSISLMAGAVIAPVGDNPMILANGYQSWSRTEVTPLDSGKPVESWWVTALRGASRSCVFGFLSNINGLNSIRVERSESGIAVTDRSDLRRVRISTSASGTSLDAIYLAWGNAPSTMLKQYAAAARGFTSALDGGRAAANKPVPTGWCSWYGYTTGITEEQVLATAGVALRDYGAANLRVIQVDDGFQIAAGDWDTNARFPHGHKWLTDQLHAKGFRAGLWLAPFAVSEASSVFKSHPDWLLKRPGGSPAKMWDNASWGGAVYSLDPTLPAVRTWLLELFRRVTREWGYDYVKIDFLYYPLEPNTVSAGPIPPVEGYRAALKAIRVGSGPKTYILGCGAPIGPTVGLVDGSRIGPDVGTEWPGVVEAARNTAARQWMHGIWWQNDPDATVLREPLTTDQGHAWAALVALSGGLVMLTDDLDKIGDERRAVARANMPVTAKGARIADLWSGAKDPASVWVLPSSQSAANITVAGLFNWTAASKSITVNPRAMGVTGKPGKVHVWDVFSREYLGEHEVKLEIPPTGCRMVALTPDVAHPQLIGTDSHLTGGSRDITGVTWVSKYRALRVQMRSTPGRAFHIALSEPAGYAYQTVEATGAKIERLPSAPGSVLLEITPAKPNVRVVVRYG